MPIGNRKYKSSTVKSKVISSTQMPMMGKMMMSTKQMDKQMRSNIKSKKM